MLQIFAFFAPSLQFKLDELLSSFNDDVGVLCFMLSCSFRPSLTGSRRRATDRADRVRRKGICHFRCDGGRSGNEP
jgi:hypothetical protein